MININRIINVYLKILPFYSLIGVILSVFRSAYQEDYGQVFLMIGAVLDLIIVFFGIKYVMNKTILFILLLLFINFIVGLLNENELTRRYITDFTNPFFFFSKIFIFAFYWRFYDFSKYVKYYLKVAFLGSIILLPLTYYLFYNAGATRLSIFPPMELPFSYFMQTGRAYFFLSFVVIILYGKRAQFIGAIFSLVLTTLFFKKNEIIKYTFIILIGIYGLNYLTKEYSNNLAISRLITTVESFQESSNAEEGFEQISLGRTAEVEAIMAEMNDTSDYIFGKGLGFTYTLNFDVIYKEYANAHFSPVSFLTKYGIIFVLFFYYFLLSVMLKRIKYYPAHYLTAIGTCLFVFAESFFAYSFFVTPIFVVVFGYIIYYQNNLIIDIDEKVIS